MKNSSNSRIALELRSTRHRTLSVLISKIRVRYTLSAGQRFDFEDESGLTVGGGLIDAGLPEVMAVHKKKRGRQFGFALEIRSKTMSIQS
jgi:hypothetical protein